MKVSISKFFASLLSFFVAILFIASLATAYFYFTVYNPERFTNTVSSFIDGDYIRHDAGKGIDIISKDYGFDPSFATEINNNIDYDALSSKYFKDFYNDFISESKEIHYVEYSHEEFLKIITDNASSTLHPELFVLEENRIMLAEKYSTAVEVSINSFSMDTVQNAIAGYGHIYTDVTQIGKLFIPIAALFALFFVITLILIITKKLVGSAYTLFLTLFTISIFFTIPFGYLSAQNLPARFNISLGGGFAYINAIWTTMISCAANAYGIISAVLLAAIILVSLIAAFKKSKKQETL